MPSGTIRRRLRISLRAMMLVIVLIGTWLGWQANKAREQREAVATVRRYGGDVHYDHEFVNGKLLSGRSAGTPQWLRRLLGDEFFRQVRQVSLVYNGATGNRFDNVKVGTCDDVLARLSRLPGLKVLLLGGTEATDDGLRHIGKMAELEELSMWDGKSVTDAGVSYLAGLKSLKIIVMHNSNLTDDSLALLSSLPSMEVMGLQNNHFTDRGLARLKGKQRLKSLWIGLGEGRITDAGLHRLIDCKSLDVLEVQNNPRITVAGIEELKCLPQLKELRLSGTGVTEKEKQAMRQAMPSVKIR